ncbi:hypothetical protein G5I_05257 [Acromyrmex echinatior]|uniref:Uncharacterized protein n=1 Tax=Acromyrmex echinatior TaxID=103372 RepID=F4WHT6_ACREC|nr:hypothetical protein G5I_05257 [Acromyrmex echinatior]
MSFYFRDSPRFGDRLSGMSDDELLREMKQRFNKDKGDTFFESDRPTRADSSDRSFPHFPRNRPTKIPVCQQRTPAIIERVQALISDDSRQSLRVLMDVVKSWMETMASGRPYVFQPLDQLIRPRFKFLELLWSVERITNKSQHPNVTSLRTAFEATFVSMDSAILQRACCFKSRIEAVIQANGGYIE